MYVLTFNFLNELSQKFVIQNKHIFDLTVPHTDAHTQTHTHNPISFLFNKRISQNFHIYGNHTFMCGEKVYKNDIQPCIFENPCFAASAIEIHCSNVQRENIKDITRCQL